MKVRYKEKCPADSNSLELSLESRRRLLLEENASLPRSPLSPHWRLGKQQQMHHDQSLRQFATRRWQVLVKVTNRVEIDKYFSSSLTYIFGPFEILSVNSLGLYLPDEGDDLLEDITDGVGVSFSIFFLEDRSWEEEDALALFVEDRDDWERESIDSKEALLNKSGAFASLPFIIYRVASIAK